MKLLEMSFRDLYKQCVILKGTNALSVATDILKECSYTLAPLWDAVLCYCYIDSDAGMSFHFLCLADFENGEVDFDSYEKLLSEKKALIYRYDEEYEIRSYLGDTSVFLERVRMVDKGYHGNEQVLPTRNISVIDHLRYGRHPDDIQALLRKNCLQIEQVWVRLTGIEDGNLVGTLLNEPNNDFGIHRGNVVHVQVTKGGGKVYAVCLLEENKITSLDQPLLEG